MKKPAENDLNNSNHFELMNRKLPTKTMKYVKTLLIIAGLFGTAGFANAQTRIAHIDLQKLLTEMPEWKVANAELKNLAETQNKDLQSSYQDLENKVRLYKSEASAKSAEENETRMVEVSDFDKRIVEATQTAQEELGRKQLELLQPIVDKAKKAVQKVARAQGFQYVLDTSPRSGVILADGPDLMADVKKELGF